MHKYPSLAGIKSSSPLLYNAEPNSNTKRDVPAIKGSLRGSEMMKESLSLLTLDTCHMGNSLPPPPLEVEGVDRGRSITTSCQPYVITEHCHMDFQKRIIDSCGVYCRVVVLLLLDNPVVRANI
jgi:hypothetical protein